MPKRWVIGGTGAVLISVGLLLCGRNAAAERPTKSGKIIISDVIISGNHQLSAEQIKAHLQIQPGKEYNSAIIDDDVRELYKTGQFSNIAVLPQPDGIDRVKIYLAVREMYGVIQKVTFLGAKHIKKDELQTIAGVRPGMRLDPSLNNEGCRKIRDKYSELGRPFSDCQLIRGGGPADTEVVYQITEGPRVKVSNIQITGHTFVSAARLQQKISHWVGDTYNRKAVEASIDELYTYFRDFGYQDVRIALEIKRDSIPGEVTLIYHIHEGPRSRKADKSHE